MLNPIVKRNSKGKDFVASRKKKRVLPQRHSDHIKEVLRNV